MVQTKYRSLGTIITFVLPKSYQTECSRSANRSHQSDVRLIPTVVATWRVTGIYVYLRYDIIPLYLYIYRLGRHKTIMSLHRSSLCKQRYDWMIEQKQNMTGTVNKRERFWGDIIGLNDWQLSAFVCRERSMTRLLSSGCVCFRCWDSMVIFHPLRCWHTVLYCVGVVFSGQWLILWGFPSKIIRELYHLCFSNCWESSMWGSCWFEMNSWPRQLSILIPSLGNREVVR